MLSPQIEDRFHPIMIFGVRADRYLLQGIGIAGSSVVAVAARVLFK